MKCVYPINCDAKMQVEYQQISKTRPRQRSMGLIKEKTCLGEADITAYGLMNYITPSV